MTRRPAKLKVKSPATPRQKAASVPNDAGLIRDCVAYAQSFAAYHNGFKADPSGNNDFAESLGDKYSARAATSLAKITAMAAKTAEGLQAKARIVPMVIDDSPMSMERDEEAFLRSFASDVKAFLEPIIHEHWSAEIAAQRGKAA